MPSIVPGKMLCWLGIHKWEYDFYNYNEKQQYRRCKRCGLFQTPHPLGGWR